MVKFIFNNKNSFDDMDCIIVGTVTYPMIKEEVTLIPVEGRKAGSLTKKTGNYNDLKLSLKLKLVKMDNYNSANIKIQDWLENIVDNRLYFEDNSSKCYKVKTVNYTDITPSGGYQATYDIQFVCEPFMKSTRETEITVNKGDIVINSGYMDSEPIIRLSLPSNKQNIQLDINGLIFEIRDCYGDIEINSNLMLVTGLENFKTIGNPIILKKGNNTINWVGTINKFTIEKNTIWRG